MKPGSCPRWNCPKTSKKSIAALSNEESSMDEVIRRSGLPASAVSVALLGLEMKRLAKQLPGRLFVRNA